MVITEPWIRSVSPKVKVLFGYKDGHAKLEVLAPIGIKVPVNLTAVEIEKIKRSFDKAHARAMMTEAERGKLGIEEEELDPRGKVTFGFPDGHVVISVRVVAKVTPWIPLDVTREELLEGKKIMDEVYQWTLLPQDVRDMQSTLVS